MSKLPNALVVALDRIDWLGARARAWALLGTLRALRRLTERVRARVREVEVTRGPRAAAPAAAEPEPARVPGPGPAALLGQLARANAWEERRDAALALRAHPGSATRAALLDAVADPSVEVALAACEALVEVGDAEGARHLLELASSGGSALHPFTRAGAVWAAGARAGVGDAPVLSALVHDVNTEVSSAAIEALGRIGEEGDLDVLWSVLEDGHGYYLPMSRQAAARALEARGSPRGERAAHILAVETDPIVGAALEGIAARVAEEPSGWKVGRSSGT